MTAAAFSQQTGHEAVITQTNLRRYEARVTCDCGAVQVNLMVDGPSESAVLERLSGAVLYQHRYIALTLANWKCSNCGATTGLDVDHKVMRSHGRDDRIENLRALCAGCHRQRHGLKA